jgi:hypothetical protein
VASGLALSICRSSRARREARWGRPCLPAALEPGGRITLARALLGAHPRRDPPALGLTSLRESSSLGRGGVDEGPGCTAHTPARQARSRHAWARNKQGPSPARCSRPRPHRTHQGLPACTSVPRLSQVRAAGPLRQAFSLQGPSLHLRFLLCRAT